MSLSIERETKNLFLLCKLPHGVYRHNESGTCSSVSQEHTGKIFPLLYQRLYWSMSISSYQFTHRDIVHLSSFRYIWYIVISIIKAYYIEIFICIVCSDKYSSYIYNTSLPCCLHCLCGMEEQQMYLTSKLQVTSKAPQCHKNK